MMTKFPYICTVKKTGDKFIPVMIDYDNEYVFYYRGQSSDSGEQYGFDEIIFEKNDEFLELDIDSRRLKKIKKLTKK